MVMDGVVAEGMEGTEDVEDLVEVDVEDVEDSAVIIKNFAFQ
jgi:hypothetical protein